MQSTVQSAPTTAVCDKYSRHCLHSHIAIAQPRGTCLIMLLSIPVRSSQSDHLGSVALWHRLLHCIYVDAAWPTALSEVCLPPHTSSQASKSSHLCRQHVFAIHVHRCQYVCHQTKPAAAIVGVRGEPTGASPATERCSRGATACAGPRRPVSLPTDALELASCSATGAALLSNHRR